MAGFRKNGQFAIDDRVLEAAQAVFYGARFDDEETKETIKAVYQESGELVDPHTAVGIAAARVQRRESTVPMVALATAHPAKFPDAVKDATGVLPALPERLAGILERQERYEVLANDLGAVQEFVAANARQGART